MGEKEKSEMEGRKTKIISRRAGHISGIIFLLTAIAVFIPACATPAKQVEVEQALEALRPRARELGEKILNVDPARLADEYNSEVRKYGKLFADMGKDAAPYIAAAFLKIDSRNPYTHLENLFCHSALFEALKMLGQNAVPYLIEGMKKGEGGFSTAVLLGHIGAVNELRKLFDSSEGEIKIRVAIGLCAAGDTDALLYLLNTVEPLPGGAPSPSDVMTDYKLQQRFAISSFWTWCDFTEKQADVPYNVLAGPESKLSDNAMRIYMKKPSASASKRFQSYNNLWTIQMRM